MITTILIQILILIIAPLLGFTIGIGPRRAYNTIFKIKPVIGGYYQCDDGECRCFVKEVKDGMVTFSYLWEDASAELFGKRKNQVLGIWRKESIRSFNFIRLPVMREMPDQEKITIKNENN